MLSIVESLIFFSVSFLLQKMYFISFHMQIKNKHLRAPLGFFRFPEKKKGPQTLGGKKKNQKNLPFPKAKNRLKTTQKQGWGSSHLKNPLKKK